MATDVDLPRDYDPGQYDRPSVTVDVVVLTVLGDRLGVLLHRRPEAPFAGRWALPGGFVHLDESLEDGAARVLRDKASLADVWLEQLYTFGTVDRDPRTRVISVAYLALVDLDRFTVAVPGSPEVATATIEDGDDGPVVSIEGTRADLAFDHGDIVATAVARLRGKLDYTPVGYQLLPDRFTIRDLRRVHETILGTPITASNFHRRMLASGELEPTGEYEEAVGHRPAKLYRFQPRN